MAKAEEKFRIFKITDLEMIQSARVFYGLFTEDKPLFTTFDTQFADPFGTEWMAKIEEVSGVASDDSNLAYLGELTKNVTDKMEECKTFYQQMKYFIEKAFPGKKEIWIQFGYNDYDNARKGETKMIHFLGMLSKTAIQYSTQLIDAGFTQEKIDRIISLQTELINADYEQEVIKKKRPALTQERIEKLNECYGYMQKVSKAAKIIFASDYGKYNQYLLPGETPAKKEEEPAQPVS